MKSSLLVVAVAGSALAKPLVHQHQKRDRVVVYKNVVEQACKLSGSGGSVSRNLAYADCRRGLENGTYKAMGTGQFPFRGVSTLITKTIIEATPTPEPVKETPVVVATATATPKPAIAPPAAPQPHIRVADMSQGLTTAPEAYPRVHEDFPDGAVPCSQFPIDYAVPVPWQNMGGWASVQAFSGVNTHNRIVGLANQVDKNCFSGSYCSYNCPAGMIKAQWPDNQGEGGQSVGGLECRNDLLYLSRAHVTRKLCVFPPKGPEAYIRNDLDQVVSICATNYPGDEGMTMWQEIKPGETQPLAVPPTDFYLSATEGKPTTRQYYLNPKGYNAKEACRWGDASRAIGNWSPVNAGLGWSRNDGLGYFALFNNAPTQTSATLGYNVELTGGNFPCTYDNAFFHYQGLPGGKAPAVGPTANGCTVGVEHGGKATIRVF